MFTQQVFCMSTVQIESFLYLQLSACLPLSITSGGNLLQPIELYVCIETLPYVSVRQVDDGGGANLRGLLEGNALGPDHEGQTEEPPFPQVRFPISVCYYSITPQPLLAWNCLNAVIALLDGLCVAVRMQINARLFC